MSTRQLLIQSRILDRYLPPSCTGVKHLGHFGRRNVRGWHGQSAADRKAIVQIVFGRLFVRAAQEANRLLPLVLRTPCRFAALDSQLALQNSDTDTPDTHTLYVLLGTNDLYFSSPGTSHPMSLFSQKCGAINEAIVPEICRHASCR